MIKINLEQVIAEEIAKAKEYKAQADSGWSFLPRKRLSHLECERNKYYAKRHNQIATWLKELQECRKAPEIIFCKDCARRRKNAETDEYYCRASGLRNTDYDFCSGGKRAERRTNNN